MKRNLSLVVVLSLLGFQRPITGLCQAPLWSALLQGTNTEIPTGLCLGDNGTLYMTGKVSDGTLAGEPVNVIGAHDMFLAKFAASGALQWVVTAGGPESFPSNDVDGGNSLVYDSATNAVYVCGGYKGSAGSPAIFGPGIEAIGEGGFIAKYDTAGTCLWMNSTNGGSGRNVGVDDAGNAYLYCFSADEVGMTMYMGSPNVLAANGPTIGKYSNTGQLLWAKSLGHHIGGAIEVHGERLYFVGSTYQEDPILLGEAILHNATFGVSILAALDTSATQILWRTTYLSTVLSNFRDVSIANDSTILAVGGFRDSLFVATDTLIAPATETRPFCAAIDTSGATRWLNVIDANTTFGRISAAPDGSFYQLLRFSGTMQLPNATLTTSSTGDMVIIRCQPNGTPIGATQCGPVESAMDVLVLEDNSVAVCGRFLASVDLGGGVVYTGNNDAFIAKYDAITGISALPVQQSQLFIYANPNKGTCTIELPDQLQLTDDLMLSIVDQTGHVVQRMPVRYTPQGVAIDIRAQAKGLYHVELADGLQRYTGTIVFE